MSDSQQPPRAPAYPGRTVAWSLFALVAISVAARSVVRIGYLPSEPGAATTLELLDQVLFGLLGLVFALLAALIVSRRPGNVIAWLMMAPALTVAVGFPASDYLHALGSAPSDVGPLLRAIAWFDGWSWLLLIFPVLVLVQLFPTGRPLDGVWRWLTYASVLLAGGFVALASLVESFGPFGTGDATWTITNPIGLFPTERFPIGVWFVLLAAVAIGSAISLVVRYRRSAADARAQIRWLVFAASAFLSFYVSSLLAYDEGAGSRLLSTLLPVSILPIPVAIAFAILRYRLWDIDLVIRRTLVYVPLTALLAGLFSATMSATHTLFGNLAGARSQTASVLTTIVVVAAFDPLKRALQRLVDARFKEDAGPAQRWNQYAERLAWFVDVHDPDAVVARTLGEAVAAFGARGGRVYLHENGGRRLVHAVGEAGTAAEVTVPLTADGAVLGTLELGPRLAGRPYGEAEHTRLASHSGLVGRAIALAARSREAPEALPGSRR